MLIGTRRVHRPALVTVHRWLDHDRWRVCEASHDGFLRLPGAIRHRRRIVLADGPYCVLVDDLEGNGHHTVDVLFHLPADTTAEIDATTGACRVTDGEQRGLAVTPLSPDWAADVVTAATDPIQGWVASRSGERVPAPVLRYRRSSPAPVRFAAAVVPFRGASPSVTASVSPVGNGPDDERTLRIRVDAAAYSDHLTFEAPNPAAPSAATSLELRRLGTDGAALAAVVVTGGAPPDAAS
jgi:hypothetical protein